MNTQISNKDLAQILFMMGNMVEKFERNEFKSEAYKKASREIEKNKNFVCLLPDQKSIDDVKYVGKVISNEIYQYCKSGYYKRFEDYLDMLSVKEIICLAEEIDTEVAEHLVDSLNLQDFYDLLKVFENGRIKNFIDKDSPQYRSLESILNVIPSWYSRKLKEDTISENQLHVDESVLIYLDRQFRKRYPFDESNNKPKEFFSESGKFLVKYSTSESAYDSNKVGDWVNILLKKDDKEKLWTVVTSTFGEKKGKRVVLGFKKNKLNKAS